MEVQCDVDINNAKIQPAQIHFHPDIVLLCIIIKFIFLKESYHIYEEKSIFLFGLMYDMLASFIGINATVNNISAMMYKMAVLLVFNDTFNIVTN
jgi:cell shape-determining protein MreD